VRRENGTGFALQADRIQPDGLSLCTPRGELHALWETVVTQVQEQGLMLGVFAQFPTERLLRERR